MENYKLAVQEFNSIKSFNIVLPENVALYDKLCKYTDVMLKLKDILSKYEIIRKSTGEVDNDVSTEICRFVVHINQLTNEVKKFEENDMYLYF